MTSDCGIRDCGDPATMELMGRWRGPVLAVCGRHAEMLRAYRQGRTRLATRVWMPKAHRPRVRVASWDSNGVGSV